MDDAISAVNNPHIIPGSGYGNQNALLLGGLESETLSGDPQP